jgi:hypothetical protein
MADRTDPLRPDEPDTGLAAELRELGRWLDVPAAPDLRPAVRARLAAGAGPARVRLGPTWSDRSARVAAMLVAFAVLLAGTLAASPRARAAVVEFCTFGAVRLHSGPAPGPPIGLPPTALPGGSRFGDPPPGTRETTLADARRTAGFPVAVPAALGAPDQVLVRVDRPGFVALRYGPRAGQPRPTPAGVVTIELDEFAGALGPFLDKYVGAGGAERITVGTDRGLWIDGPHEVAYVDSSGETRFESARLAGRTLIWERGGVTLRLEGELSREQALAIALSVP